jgi:hypothetical protein
MIQSPISFSDIATDILGHVPVAGVFKVAIQKVFKKRLDAAREILLEEMKQGDKTLFDAAELEEVAATIYRYARAAQEGAARINLRLMAQVISGKNFSEMLTADKFLYYADIISSLRMEEIKLLGIMIREKATQANTASKALKEHFSEQESEEIFQSLLRTGLVIFSQEVTVEEAEYDRKMYNKDYKSNLYTDFHLTSLMNEICQLTSFKDALAKEYANDGLSKDVA